MTKIYKTSRLKKNVAINNISFSLPDTGLVFITGKSGSGKSTLLNIIGAIDSFDNGEIEVFGNRLSEFNEEDAEKYRSSIISFIFQNYYLLEELTIKENVSLLCEEEISDERIDEVLTKLEISQYKDFYPSMLSGGEQQRVSIARAILKNPKIVLCDEPTGNLDKNTSIKIIEVLKELSQDKLVIIVSHDEYLAYNYGDKIIELSYGKLISNRIRVPGYQNEVRFIDDTIYLPYNKNLDEKDLEMINNQKNIKRILQKDDGFVADLNDYSSLKEEIKLNKIPKKNVFNLFIEFMKSKVVSSIISILIVIALFTLFAVIQSFLLFNSDQAVLDDVVVNNNYVINYTDGYNTYYLEDTFINKYTGYEMVNYCIRPDKPPSYYDISKEYPIKNNFNRFFIRETPGTICCDLAYLEKIYGKVEVLAGNLDDVYNSCNIIITDYVADSLLYFSTYNQLFFFNSYDDIINKPMTSNTKEDWGRVAAIIKTDYKEKYADIIDVFEQYNNHQISSKDVENYMEENPIYIDFINEALTFYGVNYTFLDKNTFLSRVTPDIRQYVRMNDYHITNGIRDIYLQYTKCMYYKYTEQYKLVDNEICLPYEVYNSVFGTDYVVNDFTRMDNLGEIKIYRMYGKDDLEKSEEYTFKVIALAKEVYMGSYDTMFKLNQINYATTRLYVENDTIKDKNRFADDVAKMGYSYVSIDGTITATMTKYIDMFRDLFLLFDIIVAIALLIYIIRFGWNSIKKNRYQIGVIKALGGTQKNIRHIFITKLLIIGFIMVILSYVLSLYLMDFANFILLKSIRELLGKKIYNLKIISRHYYYMLLDVAILIVSILISALINSHNLKKIRPIDIIKAND